MNEPTEKMAYAARGFILGLNLGNTTFDSMKQHLELLGVSIDSWPDWAKSARGHITKEAQAILIYMMMDSAK